MEELVGSSDPIKRAEEEANFFFFVDMITLTEYLLVLVRTLG